jgi:hypothetical protein
MRSLEMPHKDRFDELLDAEIARMRDPSLRDAPANPLPLSLQEYRDFARDRMELPSEDQIANFLDDFGDHMISLFRNAQPGDKLVPLLMPHEHGFPTFEPERIRQFGHLYYYVLDSKNIALLPSDVAAMGAVLPPEILRNGVVLSEDFKKLEKWRNLSSQFRASVLRMLEMMK